MLVVEPAHTEVLPLNETTGSEFTVTVAEVPATQPKALLAVTE